MQAKKTSAAEQVLLDPGAPQWAGAEQAHLAMKPTPIGSQPTDYIRAAWKDRPYGSLHTVLVQSLHDGQKIFFRLEWEDPEKNDRITDSGFPDGAALLFPMGADAPILTMGDKQHPVNAWHWRADLGNSGRNNLARGLGTTVLSEKSHITCQARWEKGVWRVVFARPMSVPDQASEAVQLKPGQQLRFGVAVWQGQNAERAGIKAFSQAWRVMTIEA